MRRHSLQDDRGATARDDLPLHLLPAIDRFGVSGRTDLQEAGRCLFRRAPKTYDHRSDSSHKRVTLNFCGRCGTKIFLDLERFPDVFGLCGGTFDDPNWFQHDASKCRHIFTRSAQNGIVLPAGVDTFTEHALQLDGTPNEPTVLAHALMVSRRQIESASQNS